MCQGYYRGVQKDEQPWVFQVVQVPLPQLMPSTLTKRSFEFSRPARVFNLPEMAFMKPMRQYPNLQLSRCLFLQQLVL